MINERIEELKEMLNQDGAQNVYQSKEVTLENFIHFLTADDTEAIKLLTQYGVQDMEIFRQALLNDVLNKARQRNNQRNNNNNVQRGNGIQNRVMNARNAVFGNNGNIGIVADNEDNPVEEVILSEEFRKVYEQAQIVEYKKQNNTEDGEGNQEEIADTDINDIDPSFDSLLKGVSVLCQIERRNLPIVAFLAQYGFNWQDFLTNRNVLEDLCLNLNQLAKDGKIDKVIGREDEILMAAQILGKKKKANPVFLGKPGVGKTAIAEGLAYKIVHQEEGVPHTLSNAVIFALNTTDIVSGTQYRGQFEKRLKELLEALKKMKEEGEVEPILFIDEIHTIVGTGGAEGTNDMANAIKSALSKGEIRCMGATTDGEYNKHIMSDAALKRRFQPIRVYEPSREETIEILTGAKSVFEDRHELEFSDDAIIRCVDLSIKHINETALPDKAIDLMDFAGSMYRIESEEEVEPSHMERALARYKKIPLERIVEKAEDTNEATSLSEKLNTKVFGQNEAIDAICEVIEISKAGMSDDNKPIASFLLTGPTGVGKTETAKQLADLMQVPLQRVDMSEYMEKHAISKLIGTSAGYVGYEDTPLLTKILTETSHCVLLLDEMEKAHPDIHNILLQAMDNGMVRDGHHNELSFENVVILMTSNAGAREMQAGGIGLAGTQETGKAKSNKEVDRIFSPEFRGRLDGILQYNSLPIECMGDIVKKRIAVVNEKSGLKRNGLELILDKKATDFLIQKGYNKKLGARPLNNAIAVHLEKMVTRELLRGKLKGKKNKKIKVTAKDGKLTLTVPRK